MMLKTALLFCTVALLRVACAGSVPASPSTRQAPIQHPAGASATLVGVPGCQPSSPVAQSPMGMETQGTGSGATLWALLFNYPIYARENVKIVWRMTGSGPFQLVARGPHAAQLAPTWGPEKHLSSNWMRPGEEWGTGFNFLTPGCWDLHATRDTASGDVWLVVQQAP
jgi:hypothetical protein